MDLSEELQHEPRRRRLADAGAGHQTETNIFELLARMGEGQWALVWTIIRQLQPRDMINFIMAASPSFEHSVHNKSVQSFLSHIPRQMFLLRLLDNSLSSAHRMQTRVNESSILLADNLQARQQDPLEDLLPVSITVSVQEPQTSDYVTLTSECWQVINAFDQAGATVHFAHFVGDAGLLFSRLGLGLEFNPVRRCMANLTQCSVDLADIRISNKVDCDYNFSVATGLRVLVVNFGTQRVQESLYSRQIEPNDLDISALPHLTNLEYRCSIWSTTPVETLGRLSGNKMPDSLERISVLGLFLTGQFFKREALGKYMYMRRCSCDKTLAVFAARLNVESSWLAIKSKNESQLFYDTLSAATAHAKHLTLSSPSYGWMLPAPFYGACPAQFSNLTTIVLQYVHVSQKFVDTCCVPTVRFLTLKSCELHTPSARIMSVPGTVSTTIFITAAHARSAVVNIAALLNCAGRDQSVTIMSSVPGYTVHGNILFSGFAVDCSFIHFADTCVLAGKRVVMQNVTGADVSEASEVVLRGCTSVDFNDLAQMGHCIVTLNDTAAQLYLTQCIDTLGREQMRFNLTAVLTTVNINPLRNYFEAMLAAVSSHVADVSNALEPFRQNGSNKTVTTGFLLAMHAMFGCRWDTYADLARIAKVNPNPHSRWSQVITCTDKRTGYNKTITLDIGYEQMKMYNRGRRQHDEFYDELLMLRQENAALKRGDTVV